VVFYYRARWRKFVDEKKNKKNIRLQNATTKKITRARKQTVYEESFDVLM